MAIGVTVTDQSSIANLTERRGTFNLGTYATGGVAFTPLDFGFSTVALLDFPSVVMNAAVPMLVVRNGAKLQAFAAGGTEIANGTNLAAALVGFAARGIV